MSKKTIRMDAIGAKSLKLDQMTPTQGDLKTLPEANYEKLKAEILELGFSEPITVWTKGDEKYYILNGHQRHTTLLKMQEEGYEIPEIPVSLVKAESKRQASEKVLSLTSQYGVIDQDGLVRFAEESEIELAEIAGRFVFPEIDTDALEVLALNALEEFEAGIDENPVGSKKDTYDEGTIKQVVLYFDPATYEDALQKLETLLEKTGLEDYSTLIKKLIDDAAN